MSIHSKIDSVLLPWKLENPDLPQYVIPKEIHLPGHRLLRFRHRVFRGPRGQYPYFAFPGITLYWQFCSQILKINLFPNKIYTIPCKYYIHYTIGHKMQNYVKVRSKLKWCYSVLHNFCSSNFSVDFETKLSWHQHHTRKNYVKQFIIQLWPDFRNVINIRRKVVWISRG